MELKIQFKKMLAVLLTLVVFLSTLKITRSNSKKGKPKLNHQ